MISRAGEVGQRLHLRTADVLPLDGWSDEHKRVACESEFSDDELAALVSKLGVAVEEWLTRAIVDRICKRLLQGLGECKKERHGDDRFYSEIEQDDLQELPKVIPALRQESLPLLPERPGGEANRTCCRDVKAHRASQNAPLVQRPFRAQEIVDPPEVVLVDGSLAAFLWCLEALPVRPITRADEGFHDVRFAGFLTAYPMPRRSTLPAARDARRSMLIP